jgi:hypothetical protein
MRSPLISALAVSSFALVLSPAFAEDRHRELGAHVHGHGTLNIAIEDKRVALELEVAGMDVVGFEHAASTPEQKAAVDKAKGQLEKPLDVFALPAEAGCNAAEAKVVIETEAAHGDHDHKDGHDHDAKGSDDHDGHDHDHGDKAEGGHSHFHATYALDCTSPAELTTITFNYFKLFPGAKELTVNVVGAKGQSSYEVSRDKPTLDLAGVM